VWERGGSSQGLQQGVHDRVVTAAVAHDRQPKPAAPLKQRLAQLGILLLELGGGGFSRAERKSPCSLTQQRKPRLGQRSLRQLVPLKISDRQLGGGPKQPRRRGLNELIKVGGPHHTGLPQPKQGGQDQMPVRRRSLQHRTVEVAATVLLVRIGPLEQHCVLIGRAHARVGRIVVEALLQPSAEHRIAQIDGCCRDVVLRAVQAPLELQDHLPRRRDASRRRRSRAKKPPEVRRAQMMESNDPSQAQRGRPAQLFGPTALTTHTRPVRSDRNKRDKEYSGEGLLLAASLAPGT